MQIKSYNIKGSKWYKVKLYLIDNKLMDIKCDCIWGTNNQNAWKEGKPICKHCIEAIEKYKMEQTKKKPIVKGYKKLPNWLRSKYLNECSECQLCGSRTNLQIHRIKRGNVGGLYTDCGLKEKGNNIMVLCKDCHSLIHSNEIGFI